MTKQNWESAVALPFRMGHGWPHRRSVGEWHRRLEWLLVRQPGDTLNTCSTDM